MENYGNNMRDKISRNELFDCPKGCWSLGCGYRYQTSKYPYCSKILTVNQMILFCLFSISHVYFVANGHYLYLCLCIPL